MTRDKLLVKVCGLTDSFNAAEMVKAGADYLGFIFVASSPRYVPGMMTPSAIADIPAPVRTVGVFADAEPETLVKLAGNHKFHAIQLHGDERPSFCREIKCRLPGLALWKTFSLYDGFDFDRLREYEPSVDLFLFDTRSNVQGGSGQKFNWDMLQNYHGEMPFFLSGGIGPGDASTIRKLHAETPRLCGVDLNSRFESRPGVKHEAIVRKFIEELHE